MSTIPRLSLIVAKSRNGVIGRDGALPWRLSSDLRHFKSVTLGKPCLMGRKTWDSLPFALPGRPNLVLSRNAAFKDNRCESFTDIGDMVGRGYELAGYMDVGEIMVIGGAQIYARLLPYCDRIYVTEVDTIIDGDAHFPAIFASEWSCLSEQPHKAGPKDDYDFTIKVYERRKSEK